MFNPYWSQFCCSHKHNARIRIVQKNTRTQHSALQLFYGTSIALRSALMCLVAHNQANSGPQCLTTWFLVSHWPSTCELLGLLLECTARTAKELQRSHRRDTNYFCNWSQMGTVIRGSAGVAQWRNKCVRKRDVNRSLLRVINIWSVSRMRATDLHKCFLPV